jgi:hypothetical protein
MYLGISSFLLRLLAPITCAFKLLPSAPVESILEVNTCSEAFFRQLESPRNPSTVNILVLFYYRIRPTMKFSLSKLGLYILQSSYITVSGQSKRGPQSPPLVIPAVEVQWRILIFFWSSERVGGHTLVQYGTDLIWHDWDAWDT